jgi:hypothetical protein
MIHFGNGGLFDKDGSFHSLYQNDNEFEITKLFLDHVFQYHDLLENIILIVNFNLHLSFKRSSLSF